MFWNKKVEDESLAKRLLCAEDTVRLLSRSLDDLKDTVEKLEIKALESRKIYGKKLKQLAREEEESETQGINNPVILPYHGAFQQRF